MLVKVKDHSTLRRDDVTGAIVQVDNEEWGKHKMRIVNKQIAKERDEKLKELDVKIETLTKLVEKMSEPKPTLWQRIQATLGFKNSSEGKGSKGKIDLG